MPSKIAIGSTMAREVVLDANVIVAQLDGGDALFDRARALGQRLREEGVELVILDVVRDTGGRLNFNDALLAVLQRENFIGEVASFDQGFDVLPDIRRIV